MARGEGLLWKLAESDEVEIETRRDARSPVHRTVIWIVPTKHGIYVRSVKGKRGGAEFHPDAGWLRDNGRDPVMAKGVEFSNIPNFERELNQSLVHLSLYATSSRLTPYASAISDR